MSDDPAEMTEAEREVYAARDRDRWAQSAAHIIESHDVLSLFEKEWRNTMAGEEANAKLLYLVATSRLFPRCMHAAIKGPSSAGKSELRKRVIEFIPPEDVISFTTLSERALLYFEEDFPHKVLSMGEAAGTEEASLQDYLLRELISEGRLRYPVVQKDKAGLATVVIEKNGPVAFMVTTTKAALHPENETRMLSLEIDDSDRQTVKVLSKVAEVYGLNQERAGIDYEPWRDFQRWLAAGNRNVVIPFAEKLAQLIPPRSVRLRRDFTQILLAIKAHALLHRQHREVDERGQITATMDDYRAVHRLMNALIAESSGAGIRPGLQETMEAVTLATEGLPSTDGATAQAVGKILKLDKSTARRRLVAAAHEGLIVNLETRRGQPGRYRVTGQKIEVEEVMPDPSTLSENKHHRTTADNFDSLNNDVAVAKPLATGLPPVFDHQVIDIANRTGLGGTVAAVAELSIEFEERAAIREYDGGMPRAQAEAMAATEVPELPDFLDRRLKRGAA